MAGNIVLFFNPNQFPAPAPPPPAPPLPPAHFLFYTPNPTPHARLKWIPNPRVEHPPPQRVSEPLTSFPLFRYLPPELRLRIWAFASGEARVVEIRSLGDTLRNEYTPIKFSVSPNYKNPITLRICQESRREALRLYKHVRIGVSAAVLLSGKSYIPWDFHPAFRRPIRPVRHGGPQVPLAWPRKPVDVYLNFDLDTIYLGPEFRPEHLERFLTAVNAGYELSGLKYLAMDRKFWIYAENDRFEYLRKSLFALKSRPLKELYIVPDDERNFLEDIYYYQRHAIDFVEPDWPSIFTPAGQEENAKPVVEELNTWFEDMWTIKGRKSPPAVRAMSVRRNGHKMNGYPMQRPRRSGFKEGIWEIQEALGDMRLWKTWSPPSEPS